MSYQDTVQTMRVLQERIAELEAERDKLKDKIESAVETLQYSEDTHALVALKILTKGDNQ